MEDGFGYQANASTKSKQKDIDDDTVETSVFWLKNIAITYGLLSVGCIVSGSMTLSYASSNLTWPFSSGSGIWTGFGAFMVFAIGFRTFIKYDVRDPAASRCWVITFFTLVITCITFGALHLSYSAVGYSYCVKGFVKDNKIQCFPDEKARITLTEGFNIAFGVMICLLSILTTIYMSTKRRLMALTGAVEQQIPGVYGTCCYGNCVCYSDC